jgi:translation initiation factor IF-1
MKTTSTPAVAAFRKAMREQDNVRFEVIIGSDVAALARATARSRKTPIWALVEDAIKAHCGGGDTNKK